jgi:hypothetical protein
MTTQTRPKDGIQLELMSDRRWVARSMRARACHAQLRDDALCVRPTPNEGAGRATPYCRRELMAERDALDRWAGDGGAPDDPWQRMARIEVSLVRLAQEGRLTSSASARRNGLQRRDD